MNRIFLRPSRLSWKLAIFYALIFSVILLLLNGTVLYGVRWFLLSQAEQETNDAADKIADEIIGTPPEQMSLNNPDFIGDVILNPSIVIRIADPTGSEVNRSSSWRLGGPPMTDNLENIRQLDLGNKPMLVQNRKVINNRQTLAYVQVLDDLSHENNFTRILLILMLAANAAGIALSLLAGFLTSRRLLSPIDNITKTVQKIDISGLDTHVDEGKADDELSRLAKTFNSMIDRLRLSFEKQNRFISDASHELRTPIAVVRGYSGLLQKWGRSDESIFNESVNAIASETSDMAQLIDKLLLLAKSDSGRITLNLSEFDLRELLEEVSREGRMLSQSHSIVCTCRETTAIKADRLMIKQALLALLENSIKFTPTAGCIQIDGSLSGGFVELSVKDNGIGIPGEDIERIFDRFYRVDSSRSKQTGGSGLGLSIVQLIVDAHAGSVEAQSERGKGTTVTIRLPVDKCES